MAKLDKLVDKAREHLEPNETVDEAVLGAYETKRMGQDTVRNGILMATNRRLVFYAKKRGGYDLESFPYENISSFEQGKNMMGGNVSFFASGNKVQVKWIKEGDLRRLVDVVKSRMGKPSQPSTSAPASGSEVEDIPAQIQKLAALRESGILTDDEFASKKADLLSRM